VLLIDDLLLSPIAGFKFILRTLVRAAEEQYTDDTPLKERLLELQTLLEEGSITEEEYVGQERAVLAELREVQRRRMEMAGITPEDAERMGRPMLEIPVQLNQAVNVVTPAAAAGSPKPYAARKVASRTTQQTLRARWGHTTSTGRG